MKNLILETKGQDTEVRLYENRIEYKRTGLGGLMMHGSGGTKIIALKSITAIQFLKDNFIQFAFMGSQESKSGYFAATKDENTIMFNKKQNADFEQIRDYIVEKFN